MELFTTHAASSATSTLPDETRLVRTVTLPSAIVLSATMTFSPLKVPPVTVASLNAPATLMEEAKVPPVTFTVAPVVFDVLTYTDPESASPPMVPPEMFSFASLVKAT